MHPVHSAADVHVKKNEHGSLFKEIEAGKELKHAETVDKSVPAIEKGPYRHRSLSRRVSNVESSLHKSARSRVGLHAAHGVPRLLLLRRCPYRQEPARFPLDAAAA